MSAVYLIKRGPKPGFHRAPYHPVIICAKKPVAKWEAGWTGDAAWLWSHERGVRGGGWLLERWNGFDVDYGHVVRGVAMPDGTPAAFVHESTGREPWTLLEGAVWWDDKKMPGWMEAAGVIYPPDNFTRQRVLDTTAGDGSSGFSREWPDFWPEPHPVVTVEVEGEPRIPNGETVSVTVGIGYDEHPTTGTVLALTRTTEWVNGGFETYSLRLEDGSETARYRDLLERANPDKVAPASTPTTEEPQ